MRALLIEDDPAALELLRYHLQKFGSVAMVAEATTFADAEALVANTDYDLVLLDVDLPGGSGIDLIPRMRRDAKIIFVTGQDRYAARAFELEAVDYIVKPITTERLE